MRPDWVDPDDREGLPDEATVVRELERSKWWRIGYDPWRALLMIPILALLFPIIPQQLQQREWRRLIQAGGGEVRYMATERACMPRPHPSWRGKGTLPRVDWGARIAVVAWENDWALTSYEGEPCWVPLWSIRESPPEPPRDAQGRICSWSCYPQAPPGWEAAQRAAACSYDLHERLYCFLDRLSS